MYQDLDLPQQSAEPALISVLLRLRKGVDELQNEVLFNNEKISLISPFPPEPMSAPAKKENGGGVLGEFETVLERFQITVNQLCTTNRHLRQIV